MNRTLVARAVILVGVVLAIATPAVGLAQTNDTFTADSVTCAGTGACEVNVYLKDVAGTPIGSDQGTHKKIDQLAFVVAYTATTASCMDSTTPFFRTTNGILQPIILDGPPSLVTSKPKVQFTSQGYVFSISEADVATGVPTNTATA